MQILQSQIVFKINTCIASGIGIRYLDNYINSYYSDKPSVESYGADPRRRGGQIGRAVGYIALVAKV